MRLIVVMVVAGLGCGGDGSKAVDALPSDAAVDAPPDACVARAPHTFYVNRTGGTYTPGMDDDSRTNVSRIITAQTTIPPTTIADADWTAALTCLRTKLAPYAVTITDQDPGTAAHIEVVVIANGSQIGIPNAANVAPFAPCMGMEGGVDENTIGFAAWTQGISATEACWNAAQLIGYTVGLDHVIACPDLMSVKAGCDIAAKAFTNTSQMCGEDTARVCHCGGANQNAAVRLLANLGPSCQ